MSEGPAINPKHVVSYTYANRPERTVSVGAGRVHAIMTGEVDIDSTKQPIRIADARSRATYGAWCDLHGVEPQEQTPAIRERAAPQKRTPGVDARDGWPDEGVEYTVSGGWYTVTVGEETKRARGKTAAIELAWKMAVAVE